MYRTQSNVIRGLSKKEYGILRKLCQYSNNLYNVALYNIRQYYFQEKKFLKYEENYHICKENESSRGEFDLRPSHTTRSCGSRNRRFLNDSANSQSAVSPRTFQARTIPALVTQGLREPYGFVQSLPYASMSYSRRHTHLVGARFPKA